MTATQTLAIIMGSVGTKLTLIPVNVPLGSRDHAVNLIKTTAPRIFAEITDDVLMG